MSRNTDSKQWATRKDLRESNMEMKRNDAVMKMKMIAIHRGTLASKQLAFSDHMLAQGQNLVHPLSPSENTATVQSQRTHPTHTHTTAH